LIKVDRIAQIIEGSAKMGRPGDGWIRVFELEREVPSGVESETASHRAA